MATVPTPLSPEMSNKKAYYFDMELNVRVNITHDSALRVTVSYPK